MEMSDEGVLTYIFPNSGIVVPNRIFVGGIPYGCTSDELKQFFSSFGFVTGSKIIKDNEGVSKGYGFISFERKSDAQNVLRMGTVFFREKRLRIGPAIRRSNELGRRMKKESLEDTYLARNGVSLSLNNAIFSSAEYPAMTYDANSMPSPYPMTSTLNIGSPHCPKMFNCPSSYAVSGCMISQTAKECCAMEKTALPQSTIVRHDLFNQGCAFIACSTPYIQM